MGKFPITIAGMQHPATPPSAPPTDSVLAEALAIAQPLVAWLIRSGVGYAEFAAALKPVFLAQAQQELVKQGEKMTDSAVSLRSGLHRKDVRAFRATAADSMDQVKADGTRWGKPSASSQVATRWLSDRAYPDRLPVSSPTGASFEALARSTSKDVHPRAVLQDLVRLGIVHEEDGYVQLKRQAFVPNVQHQEARQFMAGSVADHLQAGVHNLSEASQRKFLEQSVFVDGLSEASMQQLNLLANELWRDVLKRVVEAATPLCKQDAGQPQPHRFRLGLFSFGEAEFQAEKPPLPAPLKKAAKQQKPQKPQPTSTDAPQGAAPSSSTDSTL